MLGRERGDGRLEVLQRFLVRDGRATPQALPDPLEARLNRASSMTLRLPAELGLRKIIRLPVAALENLREAVAFQLDRHTPFSQEEAYFDCTLLQRDEAAGQLVIEATVVARAVVGAACATADRLGWRIGAVELMREPEASTKPTRLPVADLQRKPRAQLALNAVAAIALIVLLAFAALLPVTVAQIEAGRLAPQLDAARRAAQDAAQLDKANQELRRQANFLAARARLRPPALDILLELTKLTPDDAWLDSVQYNGSEIQFAGLSSSASALIGRFAQSSLFRNMEFRSPVTPDPRSGRERFQISGQLQGPAGKPPPAAAPIPQPEPDL